MLTALFNVFDSRLSMIGNLSLSMTAQKMGLDKFVTSMQIRIRVFV